MTTIPETYTANGWNYTLIDRKGRVAIYAQGQVDAPVAYEVVRIRTLPARVLYSVPLRGHVSALAGARSKFDALVKRREKRAGIQNVQEGAGQNLDTV